jgi:serine carboxypeptidase-like clade 2
MNKSNMPANCSFDDDTTAKDNIDFMVNWFKRYSNYTDNDFYLSGESYGGIYVPLLALEIVNYNNA